MRCWFAAVVITPRGYACRLRVETTEQRLCGSGLSAWVVSCLPLKSEAGWNRNPWFGEVRGLDGSVFFRRPPPKKNVGFPSGVPLNITKKGTLKKRHPPIDVGPCLATKF